MHKTATKLKTGLEVFYNIWSGNGSCLFYSSSGQDWSSRYWNKRTY